ncbi:c-type cytochrome [Paenibacillus gallinarum]|uniref:Cytochrome c n=1 Tax=Paenibacillus gallinarum TaxID=2762232 RepID=A0ABR8T5X1_9BACL|nr:cytochrome c [Paenibacillus gallinarum]MBD7971168.1 cytochrome c [Paenibacillus gallinarum]
MKKWIMSGLFFFACAFALVLMFTVQGREQEMAEEAGPVMPQVTLDAASAEEKAKGSCISCHGNQLEGGVGPSLQKVGAESNAEQLYKTISKGKGGGKMPAFEGQLSEEEIANLALWLSEKK